ncbi:unnamed protein product [Paramecium primaurelia]|uniref:Uncharacterized protein n=1 Tax=Paramecium primaurelia TaxID=5886 RepID=A0A8S1MK03_PARPR|nr:unnamed protein product [Paramecium primaurelia]
MIYNPQVLIKVDKHLYSIHQINRVQSKNKNNPLILKVQKKEQVDTSGITLSKLMMLLNNNFKTMSNKFKVLLNLKIKKNNQFLDIEEEELLIEQKVL